MKYVPPGKPWLVVSLYLLAGFFPGLADGWLGEYAKALGFKGGIATAGVVNLLLPLIAIGLGAAYPRPGVAWLGAVGMTAAYILGLALAHPGANSGSSGDCVPRGLRKCGHGV